MDQLNHTGFYQSVHSQTDAMRELARSMGDTWSSLSGITEIGKANQHWDDLVNQTAVSSGTFADLKLVYGTGLDAMRELARSMGDTWSSLSGIAEIGKANQHWDDLVNQTAVSSGTFADLKLVYGTGLSAIGSNNNIVSPLQEEAAKLSLSGVAYQSGVFEQFVTQLDFDALIDNKPEKEQSDFETQFVAETDQETCVRLLEEVDPALVQPLWGLRMLFKVIVLTGHVTCYRH